MSHHDDDDDDDNKNGDDQKDDKKDDPTTTTAAAATITTEEKDAVESDRTQQQRIQERHKRERIAASILDDSDNDVDDDDSSNQKNHHDELRDRFDPPPPFSSSTTTTTTTTTTSWSRSWSSRPKTTMATPSGKTSNMSLRSLTGPAKHHHHHRHLQSQAFEEDGSHSAAVVDDHHNDDDDDHNDDDDLDDDDLDDDPYDAALPQEKIAAMSNMMLELVRDIVQVRPGDHVLTRYGTGELVVKKTVVFPTPTPTTDEGRVSSTTATTTTTTTTTTTLQIRFSWGTLYHRQPDMVHKVMDVDEYEQAMDHLEQVRKLQLAVQCQQWNVPIVQDACVACLFQKPETAGSRVGSSRISGSSTTATTTTTSSSSMAAAAARQQQQQRRRPWQWSSRNGNSTTSSSSTSTPSSSFSSSSNDNHNHKNNNSSHNHSSNNSSTFNTPKAAHRCDVCGNPVCHNHIMHNQDGSKELFVMCVDCSFDLTQLPSTLAVNHPQLRANLDRLLQYYIRMVLQLSFCVPNLNELADRLTERERRHSRFALGTNAVGFVGAALGVAGAATLLTPAGPAILIAAIATQATSGVLQGGHAMARRVSNKEANRLADRVLGWHGLCLGILQALERLRRDLLVERDKLCSEQDQADLLNQLLASGRRNISTSEQALQVWNVLAYGTYQTTRQGLTGVAMTAQMGASYSQVLTTSMQAVPVVGAAFSVGCMAMDATNIASTLSRMQKPSEKSVALSQIVTSFSIHIPSTIQAEVEGLLAAIMDLRERQEEAQRNQERDLIEQELEELNML